MMKHVVKIRGQVLDKDHSLRKNSEAWLEYFEEKMCNDKEEMSSDEEEMSNVEPA